MNHGWTAFKMEKIETIKCLIMGLHGCYYFLIYDAAVYVSVILLAMPFGGEHFVWIKTYLLQFFHGDETKL